MAQQPIYTWLWSDIKANDAVKLWPMQAGTCIKAGAYDLSTFFVTFRQLSSCYLNWQMWAVWYMMHCCQEISSATTLRVFWALWESASEGGDTTRYHWACYWAHGCMTKAWAQLEMPTPLSWMWALVGIKKSCKRTLHIRKGVPTLVIALIRASPW